ncbi:hypothetical protein F4801DRAFT_143495 [Xylaria longipes]|nr:hypothetical protein F4801DRAFT_143495 [Xylaria longipes]
MEPHNRPDCPPPPYSETDIYSHSRGSPNHQSNGADDDASIAPSSSHSNIIFTPPESPRDTQYRFAGPSSGQHTAGSAQAYFDSRPPNRPPGSNITITLEITSDAAPCDFPYPKRALDRDITEQDWQTFINYLIPEHTARVNSHVMDRKLRAAGDSQSSASDDIAEAQLAPLKSSATVPVSPQNIEAVIREWNHGFFEPRGVTIRHATPAEPVAEETQTPENETSREASADAGQSQSQPQQPSSWWRQQPGSSWWRNPFGSVDANNGSLRIGPLHIEGDRVAIGSTFEADSNGVRWRGGPNAHPLFEAGSRGVRWGEHRGPSLGHPHPFDHRGGHPWGGPFGGRGRGRGREHWHGQGHGRRDHSRSSTSSSSSLSSSDSDSSIGSLPDWDGLKDTQLPVTKRSVQTWLSHPDQPVTKDMLKQAKAEIKAAKSTPPPPREPSWDQARESLRREVKDLLQQFKVLKRQQKTAKRAARRERRQQKRAARQERRERRRAERHDRRGDRTTRRAERDAERHTRRHRYHNPVPPVASVSAGSPVPPGPPFPPTPHAFLAPPAFPAGLGGLFGRGSFGRGSFGAHPSPPPGFGFGFGRGFGQGHGRDRDMEQFHNVAEQTSRQAAEMTSTIAKEMEKTIATTAQDLEKILAQGERDRRKAAETAEESRRAAMEAAQRSRANADRVRDNALSVAAKQRRAAAAVAAEAVSSATVETKLAEARALESQISAKAGQIQALEENLGHDQNDEKKNAGSEKLRAIEQLEEEIERLGRKVEALRVEADEEFARHLAQRDDGWGEWK